MTAPDALRQSLDANRGDLLPLVKRAIEVSPEIEAAKFGDEELEQFLNAFVALLVEALEGRPPETRQLVLETAVPGLLASGETMQSLVSSIASSIPFYNSLLLRSVPDELRDDAVGWLAGFWGAYARDLVAAVEAAA